VLLCLESLMFVHLSLGILISCLFAPSKSQILPVE
jgi:hypothetical protein